jgi:uncharacterized protein (DUF2252 family)
LIKKLDEGRLQHLLPVKYGKMLKTPFAFIRGTAGLMAADLNGLPSSRIYTQLCGDAHIDNFGIFASPERHLIFDVNDFDETLPGPWEWDLKRLAASAVVAGRQLGYSDRICRDYITTAVRAYATVMGRLAKMTTLEAWYFRVEIEMLERLFAGSTRRASAGFRRMMNETQKAGHAKSLASLTTLIDGQRRFRVSPPFLLPLSELADGQSDDEIEEIVAAAWRDYASSLDVEKRTLLERFHVTDAATLVGGIGSIGTRCAVALVEGGDEHDAIILQQKTARRSVLEAYLGKSRFTTSAERVVHGQRLMQAASDIFLGWHRGAATGDTFYWRQLSDTKGEFDTEALGRSGFALYVAVCAGCLARAHGRAGDPALIAGYVGRGESLAQAVADFGIAYADQTERDYAAFKQAASDGRIIAESG